MARAQFATLGIPFLIGCGAPMAGTYAFVLSSEESDCPADFSSTLNPEGSQALDVDMSVPELIVAGTPDEHCPLDGMDFACEFADIDDEVDYSGDDLDALYTLDIDMVGTFTDVDTLDGVTSLYMSCDGSDCAELADQGKPACVVSWYWNASLAE